MNRGAFLRRIGLGAIAAAVGLSPRTPEAASAIPPKGVWSHPLGFAAAVRNRRGRYPLLERALAAAKPAVSCRVEWLRNTPGGRTRSATNYTQIVRTPFNPDTMTSGQALERHLADVERVLWDGKPSYRVNAPNAWAQGAALENRPISTPLATCGGVKHYLRRKTLRPTDRVSLRVLRDLQLLRHRQRPGERQIDEWLSEFSLEVRP